MYINAASVVAHIDEISELLSREKPIVLAVRESCTTDQIEEVEIECPGYKCMRVDSHSRMTGGCCMYVCDDAQVELVEQSQYNKSTWIITIKIKINELDIMMSAVYRSPSTSKIDFLNYFGEWLEKSIDYHMNHIICGDFNINLLKNDTYTNRLNNIISFHGFKQYVYEPTRITENTKSIIDLVVANFDVVASVELNNRISDHNTILIQSTLWQLYEKEKSYVNRFVNYSRDALQRKLSQYNWGELIYSECIEEKAAILTERLHVCIQSFAKRVPAKTADNSWYDTGLKSLRIKRDSAYKMAVLSNNMSHWRQYKKIRNEYCTKIRETKKTHIELKLENAKGDSKKTWQVLKSMVNGKSRCKINVMEFEGVIVSEEHKIAEKYNKYVVDSIIEINGSIVTIDSLNEVEVGGIAGGEPRFELKCVDDTYILNTLRVMNNKRDSYGISPNVLVDAWPIVGNVIVNIMNQSICEGICPSVWKTSTIVPIPKINKAIKCVDHRPINMLPTIEKLLETIVKDQLVEYIERNKILIDAQSGYRKRFSCETALNLVLNKWKMINDEQNDIVCVFLDLKRAFETIDRDRLLQKLYKMGVANRELRWFSSYLSDRKQKVKIGEVTSNEINNAIGTPQGSVLGAILFILYINDLPGAIKWCDVNLFADDTLIFCHGKNINDLINKIESDLGNIDRYLKANKLKLNVDKTKCMIIKGKRNNVVNDVTIRICGVPIDETNEMKYLGVLIDNKLNFKTNNQYVIKKVAKKIGFMSRVAKNLTAKATITLYKSIIAPHFDYCSSLLFLADSEDKQAFQRLQNRAMRIILWANRYTSVSMMLETLKWQSVWQRVVARTLQFVFKMKNGLLPDYLCGLLRYNSEVHTYPCRNRENFRLPNVKKASTQNNLFYKGLKIFNELNDDLKREQNYAIFKKKIDHYVKHNFN